MDAAVVTLDICFIWILSFSFRSHGQTVTVSMINKRFSKRVWAELLLWRTTTPTAALQCQTSAPHANITAEACAIVPLLLDEPITPQPSYRVTSVWATHRNRKSKVATSAWPLQGPVNLRTSLPEGRTGVLESSRLPSPGCLAHRRQQRTSVTVGMIHGWAQPCFSKEQPFLILAKTMRTWVKELAPLWGPCIKAALCPV